MTTEITLTNLSDNGFDQKGFTKLKKIRVETVQAEADTGLSYLVITEELRQKLGLKIKDMRIVQISDGRHVMCRITEYVKVRWKDRETIVWAMVIPCSKKIILGAIPMEAMDLKVNFVTQEVVDAHDECNKIKVFHVA